MDTITTTIVCFALAAGFGVGAGLIAILTVFFLREQLMELQDRLSELISYGPDDDEDDEDPELRDLLPIDPSAKVPKQVGPRIRST